MRPFHWITILIVQRSLLVCSGYVEVGALSANALLTFTSTRSCRASAVSDTAADDRMTGERCAQEAQNEPRRPTSPAPVQTTSKKARGQKGSENASSTFMAVDIFSLPIAACAGA